MDQLADQMCGSLIQQLWYMPAAIERTSSLTRNMMRAKTLRLSGITQSRSRRG